MMAACCSLSSAKAANTQSTFHLGQIYKMVLGTDERMECVLGLYIRQRIGWAVISAVSCSDSQVCLPSWERLSKLVFVQLYWVFMARYWWHGTVGMVSVGRGQGIPCTEHSPMQPVPNSPNISTAGHSWTCQPRWWHMWKKSFQKGQNVPW